MPATHVCPSEYSVQPPSSNASPPRCILSWNSPVVQSTYVRRVARILVRVPTSPLAISSALWFSATNTDRAGLEARSYLSSTWAFLQSLSRLSLAGPFCRNRISTGSSHGLFVPTTLAGVGGPPFAGRAKPASFHLQGLVTLLAVYSPRNLAGLVSSRQRSWDSSLRSVPLSRGGRRVSASPEPACRQSDAISHRRTCGPVRRTPTSRLWPSRESLAANGCLARRQLEAPLGFSPSRAVPPAALPGLPPGTPLSHFACPARERDLTRAPGYRSATDWPDSNSASEPTRSSRTTLLGFMCLLVPADEERQRPWLMDSPHRRPAVTGRPDPDLRTAFPTLRPQSHGINLGHLSRR